MNAFQGLLKRHHAGEDVRSQDAGIVASMSTSMKSLRQMAEKVGIADSEVFRAHRADVRTLVTEYSSTVNSPQEPPQSPDPVWELTPNSIKNLRTGEIIRTDNPIQDLIGADQWSSSGKNRPSMFTRGDVIELTEGRYHHFRITLSTDKKEGVEKVTKPEHVEWGKDPITLIRAKAGHRVIINENPTGGSQTCYLEWGGAFYFQGIEFEGDDLMGVGSERPSSARFDYHQGFRDFGFFDCSVLGSYDPETDGTVDEIDEDEPNDETEKWGILNYEMGQSSTGNPGWIWKGGKIQRIKKEHCNYFHNVQGDILLEDIAARWCGRTFFQMANRIGEGPAGKGNLTFRNIEVEDPCLQMSGGGSAFSFNGRHTGNILLDRVIVRMGANPRLAAPANENITGALVIHAGGDTGDKPNGHVVLDGCDFQVGPHFTGKDSARRGNIQVRECQSFTMMNTRVAQLGDNPREALDISPDLVEGHIVLDRNSNIIGECIFDGVKYGTYQEMLEAVKDHPKVEVVG